MTPTTEEQRAELTRSEFEAAMNERRFFPAELDFTRTKSPSGRDEYVNSHLQSNWETWQAALSRRSPPPAAEGVEMPHEISNETAQLMQNVYDFTAVHPQSNRCVRMKIVYQTLRAAITKAGKKGEA